MAAHTVEPRMQTHPSRLHRPQPSLALAFAALLALAATDRASSQTSTQTPPAPSSQTPRRAARLSFLQGSVLVSQIDNTFTTEAQLNQPIFAGSRLSTGDTGEAEIEFEDGSVVRLAPSTTVSLARLSSDGQTSDTTIAVLHGLLYAELRAGAGYLYQVTAGADQITPLTNTTLRIQIDGPLPLIASLDGTVRIERATAAAGSAGSHLDLRAGQSLQDDPADPTHYLLADSVDPNSWDTWNEARDQAAADAAGKQTAARDSFAGAQGYGWSDLDQNGSWYDVPGQGPIWQPDIATSPNFDPYGSGSWIASNLASNGGYDRGAYIFASNYTWGWTPYRCGTWSFWNTFGWGWVPDTNCGLLGFGATPGLFPGFGHGGAILLYPISIHHGPPGYRPIPPPHRPHPIVAVHPIHQPPVSPSRAPSHSFLTLTGETILPLPPVATNYTFRGASALGAPLRRDFPIDQITRRPVLGIAPSTLSSAPAAPAIPTTPTSIAINPAWRSVPARPSTPIPIALRPSVVPNPVYSNGAFTRYPAQGTPRPIAPNSYPSSYHPTTPTYAPRPIIPAAPIRTAPPPPRPTSHR